MWRVTATMLMAASAACAVGRTGAFAAEPTLPKGARGDDHREPTAGPAAGTRVLTLDQIPIAEQSAGRPWSIQRSDGVFRFEVRQGERRQKASERDRPIERSEISLQKTLSFGVDYTMRYQFMVEPGAPNTSKWVNIGQIHATEDPQDSKGLGPLFAVQLKGERMRIVARADARRTTPARPSDLWLYRDKTDLVRGRWYRMEVKIRVDPQGDGRLIVWRDGKALVNHSGPLGYNDAVGPYWKFGIYRSTSPDPLVVRFRRISLTEAVAASRAAR